MKEHIQHTELTTINPDQSNEMTILPSVPLVFLDVLPCTKPEVLETILPPANQILEEVTKSHAKRTPIYQNIIYLITFTNSILSNTLHTHQIAVQRLQSFVSEKVVHK